MKLLLTSAGLTNKSIASALADLLDKPFNQARVVFIPTAANAERGDKFWLIDDLQHVRALGWREFDIVDLAACASLPRELWWPAIDQADVLVVGGGNSFYLSYWFEKSGLFAALPELLETKVYMGISAGSMVVTESLRMSYVINTDGTRVPADDLYDEVGPAGQSLAKTAGLVDFMICPHLNSHIFPKLTEPFLQKIAPQFGAPLYALDDQSAIKMTNKNPQVISEGAWKLYNT